MPEIKFACAQCGQHISCDEAWAGHELQCPACQNRLRVPASQAAAAPAVAETKTAAPGTAPAGGLRISSGQSQGAHPAPARPQPQQRTVRPPKSTNPAIKYALTAVLILGVGLAALVFLPGVINQFSNSGDAKPAGSTAPAGDPGAAGPLGEVNGAMDVSDALDGNGPARPRPKAARQRPTPPGVSTTNRPANTARSAPAR